MTEEDKEKSVFVEWAEITTAHGFVDYVKARSICGKVAWALLLFTSLSAMIYQLVRTSLQFSEHSWSTSIQELPADGIQFPSVIICNANRIKYSKAQAYGMTDDLITYMFLNLMYSSSDTFIPQLNFSAENAFIAWRKAHNLSYTSIFDKLGPSCEDIFVTNVCGIVSVFPIDTIEYGRCYRIELNETVKNAGSKSGYMFPLNVQSWDYLPIIENNIIFEGMVVQVAYNGRVELGQWIKLYSGTLTSVGMKVIKNDLQEEEKSIFNPFSYLISKPPCEPNPKLQFSDASQYSIMNCYMECNQLVNIQLCGCVAFIQSDAYRTCEVEEIVKCSGLDRNLTRLPGTDISKQQECLTTCKKPCYDQTIATQISVTKFPSQKQRNRFQNWLLANNLNQIQLDDIIFLELYFSSLEIQETQLFEVMSMDSYVSTSGGIIGLYVGMSFLTVFQAIDYLMKFCRLRREKKKSVKPDIQEIKNAMKSDNSDLIGKPSVK